MLTKKIKQNDFVFFIDGHNESGFRKTRATDFLTEAFKQANQKFWEMYKLSFVTFIKSSVSQPLYPKPKPPTTFNTYFMENYSVIEIPPPPYCSICNKYMTNSYCNSVIKPNECPYN